MKPKPLVALNHLTVPVAMSSILSSVLWPRRRLQNTRLRAAVHTKTSPFDAIYGRYWPQLLLFSDFLVNFGHLESGFLHHHLDQGRPVGLRQGLVQRRLEARGRVDPSGGEAEALGDLGDVHWRVVEVHADRRVVAVEQLQAILEDLVTLVVGDHEDHRQLL